MDSNGASLRDSVQRPFVPSLLPISEYNALTLLPSSLPSPSPSSHERVRPRGEPSRPHYFITTAIHKSRIRLLGGGGFTHTLVGVIKISKIVILLRLRSAESRRYFLLFFLLYAFILSPFHLLGFGFSSAGAFTSGITSLRTRYQNHEGYLILSVICPGRSFDEKWRLMAPKRSEWEIQNQPPVK